jgi:hypothetical protein
VLPWLTGERPGWPGGARRSVSISSRREAVEVPEIPIRRSRIGSSGYARASKTHPDKIHARASPGPRADLHSLRCSRGRGNRRSAWSQGVRRCCEPYRGSAAEQPATADAVDVGRLAGRRRATAAARRASGCALLRRHPSEQWPRSPGTTCSARARSKERARADGVAAPVRATVTAEGILTTAQRHRGGARARRHDDVRPCGHPLERAPRPGPGPRASLPERTACSK